MKTNRPVPSDLWLKIEDSITKKKRLNWTPQQITIASTAIAIIISTLTYMNYTQHIVAQQSVNAYLYDLHMQIYPTTPHE